VFLLFTESVSTSYGETKILSL